MKTTEVFVCYNDFNMSCSGIVTLYSSVVTDHSSISCSGIITGDSSISCCGIASYDSSRSFIGMVTDDSRTSCSGILPAVELTRKLISALEAIEKLPVFTYDLPGSGYGLQVSFGCP